MKVLFSFFLIFIICSIPAFTEERYSYDNGGKIKFSIIPPDGWKINNTKDSGLILTITGPTEKSFTIQINIMIDKTNNMTIDDYINKMHETFKHPPSLYKEVKILSERIININGTKRYEAIIDYILNMQGKNLSSRTMEAIIMKDGHAFIIIGSAMENNFSKYEAIFKEVFDSFKFE